MLHDNGQVLPCPLCFRQRRPSGWLEALHPATGEKSNFRTPMGSAEDQIHRSSKRVWCHALGQWAVISVIARSEAEGTYRFVQWCSLRSGEPCDERCLQVSPRLEESIADRTLERPGQRPRP